MKEFKITGMSCAACSARVERSVSSLDGVEFCSVNLLSNSMTVETSLSDKEIIDAVKKAGYGASMKKGGQSDKSEEDSIASDGQRKAVRRLIISVVFLIPLMYLSMGYVMLSAPLPVVFRESPLLVAMLQMILSLGVLIINRRFFVNGVRGVLSLAPNMDTLVSLGSGVSFLYSIVVLFGIITSRDPHDAHNYLHSLYFESAAMILTLISVGKMLEERAKGKTTTAIKSLMDLSPKQATVIKDGVEAEIPTGEVKPGDIFVLRSGSSVPVDGVITEGECSMVESALTGESVPLEKSIGDSVYAGTVNASGYVKCKATSVGENTKISGVIKLVEEASASKAPIAKLADRVSGIFVPAIILISLVTFLAWWLGSNDPGEAVVHSIAVLVISCPCALGLATPVAIMVGSGVGARHGILFKTAEAIELTGRGDSILLDKTGTVTEGKPAVMSVLPKEGISEEKLLSLAYSAEDKSEHPQALAIVEYCRGRAEKLEAENFETFAGNGVKCNVLQTIVYGGNLKFIKTVASVDENLIVKSEELSEHGMTPLFFAEDGKCIGIIATADRVREDSKRAISEMKKMGLRVVMLTGDNRRVAESVGGEVGVDEIISDVLPEGKAQAVEKLKARGKVIMIGDGINDAPALTAADVGIAIGGGTDIAIESADAVLVKNSLADAVLAVRLGRKTLKNIKENLFFAFIYNLVGIPMAAGLFGFTLPPMFGALAMSLSSFSVVSNALRLNNFSKKIP